MVNPFMLGWFWRGLKGHSVTFGALFASVLLGASLAGGLRHLLAALGLHWLYVLILPIVIFSWLNKMEPRWIPDPRVRRRWARGLMFGAMAIAFTVSWLRPAPREEEKNPPPSATETRPGK